MRRKRRKCEQLLIRWETFENEDAAEVIESLLEISTLSGGWRSSGFDSDCVLWVAGEDGITSRST